MSLFIQTIKDRRRSLIVYSLAAVGMMLMYVSMYPSIQDKAQEFNQIMKSYPEGIMKAMNIEEMNFDTIEKFLAVEYFSFIWPILALFFFISFAGGNLAREIEKGTIEVLLAKPVSRFSLYCARYCGGMAALLLFTFISIFCIIPLAWFFDIEYIFQSYYSVSVISFLFVIAAYSMSMMFSAFFSERGKVYMMMGGILIIMYVMNVVVAFKEQWKNIQYFSFFYYYHYHQAFIHHEIDELSIIVFSSIAVVSMLIGAYWFQKKDITI